MKSTVNLVDEGLVRRAVRALARPRSDDRLTSVLPSRLDGSDLERGHRGRPALLTLCLLVVSLLLVPTACRGADGVTASTTTTTAAPGARRVPTEAAPLRVLLLGDSLAWEAKSDFSRALEATGKAEVDVMAFGGTDYCTFDAALRRLVAEKRPEVVVIEFSGNALGPCMTDPRTEQPYEGDRLVATYEADARETIGLLRSRGADVYLSTFPRTRSPHPEDDELRDVVLDLADSEPGVHLADAAAAVEARDGGYTEFLPCLVGEPCTDRDPSTGRRAARVRAPDGAHFCPNGLPAVAGVTLECDVWSSGAWRFGNAMARPVLDDYRL